MESFYDDASPMGTAGIEYKKAIEKLDEEVKTNLVRNTKRLGERRLY
jgi:putative IMPACT (imprinted ancient) family translation regulator